MNPQASFALRGRNEERALSHKTIQERVWNDESVSNTIAVRIRQLCQKVDDGHAARLIHTFYGQEYVLRARMGGGSSDRMTVGVDRRKKHQNTGGTSARFALYIG